MESETGHVPQSEADQPHFAVHAFELTVLVAETEMEQEGMAAAGRTAVEQETVGQKQPLELARSR
jgi:hypothetical protein